MVMYIIKPENENTLFKENWKKKFREKSEQDWSKVYWRDVENKQFENKSLNMLNVKGKLNNMEQVEMEY